jgi:hypothetical protein
VGSRGDVGRDLTSNERALLEWLLRDPRIPDVDALRAQIPFAQVVEGPESLPTDLDLAVSGAAPAAVKDGPLPGWAVVMCLSGEPTGHLDLWIKDGYLASIEHSWFTEEMPEEFPTPDRLRPVKPEEDYSKGPPRKASLVTRLARLRKR